jgi:hypothetical protein
LAERAALPDPLCGPNGLRAADAETWRRELRPHWLAACTNEIYGPMPPKTRIGLEVGARRGARIALAVKLDPALPPANVALYLPDGPAHAVFFGPNFAGNASVDPDPAIPLDAGWMRAEPDWGIVGNRATQATRGVHAQRWPLAEILARGYAAATWYDGDICPDDPDLCAERGEKLAVRAGAVAFWAWGFSRVLDALAQSGLVAADKAIAVGHSRHGKAALWAAATDARIAGVVANNSGAGGARPFRWAEGEAIADLFARVPHWFAPALRDFAGRETALAADQHLVLALVAPRLLYVARASDDAWAGPAGEAAGLEAAGPVYDLCGASGATGTHLRIGGHGITPEDWRRFLAFADRNRASGKL